jgi:hypothetical protein
MTSNPVIQLQLQIHRCTPSSPPLDPPSNTAPRKQLPSTIHPFLQPKTRQTPLHRGCAGWASLVEARL